jgi:hypothetical protein
VRASDLLFPTWVVNRIAPGETIFVQSVDATERTNPSRYLHSVDFTEAG